MSKRLVNEERCQQILKMVDNVELNKKQISEKLTNIKKWKGLKRKILNAWIFKIWITNLKVFNPKSP